MSKFVLRNGITIGDYLKPYFIAELNSSHNGDINVAYEMILKAKEAGCDCVKFQSWSDASLYSASYYKENPIAQRFFKKFSLSEDQMLSLSKYCRELGIDFASTPYSKREVDFLLNECNAPFIKVASMDINNHPFLEYISRTGTPIILSTGMSDYEEIAEAVSIIESNGNKNICILHCVSNYPAKIESINLNNISMLRQKFPNYAIGYSDHTIGFEAASASVALGAGIIEKHFTLDNSKIGMDNQMATEPKEMKEMIDSCNAVYKSLGSFNRVVSDDELIQRTKMRRSIVYTKDMSIGDIITIEDLDFKRPGNGVPPSNIETVLGKKLKRNVYADSMVLLNDLVVD